MSKGKTKNLTGCSCLFIIGIWVVLSIISGYCWQYSINHWLVFCHKAPTVHLWQGMLIGFVPCLGELSLPVAVLTWIVSLFM